jgi:hypothetical protein
MVLSPRATVAAFWREHVSDRLIPTYNLSKKANPKLYGCTLEFLLPPSSETRSFVAPSQYKTQKEAKNAAATLAIDAGILEEGRAAREAAGPEPVDAEDDHNSTYINAVSQLHNAYQKFMPIAPPIYQYSIDELSTYPISSPFPSLADPDLYRPNPWSHPHCPYHRRHHPDFHSRSHLPLAPQGSDQSRSRGP